MKNLYHQFSMQPPAREELGRRLTGGSPLARTAVSKAPVDFYRRLGMPTNNVLAPASYSLDSGSVSGLAHGLRGLGAFSGDPAVELVPGVNFGFDLDKRDFIAPGRPIHQEGIRKLNLSWKPVPANLVTEVRNKLAALANSTDEGRALGKQLVADGQDKATQIHERGEKVEWEAAFLGARGEVDVFGKVLRNDVEASRLNAMRELEAWMRYVVTVPVPELVYTPGGAGTPGEIALRKALAAKQGGYVPPPASKMPLLIGGAAVAMFFGIVVLKKLKKK